MTLAMMVVVVATNGAPAGLSIFKTMFMLLGEEGGVCWVVMWKLVF